MCYDEWKMGVYAGVVFKLKKYINFETFELYCKNLIIFDSGEWREGRFRTYNFSTVFILIELFYKINTDTTRYHSSTDQKNRLFYNVLFL